MLLIKIKNKINDTILKYLYMITKKRRTHYIDKKRRQLKNSNISIISNDCTGGVIYHDLGLKFMSPTINMFFYPHFYIEYLENLVYYNNAEVVEVFRNDVSYPVGEIVRGDSKIDLNFLHYDIYEKAKQKWIERSKRVDYNNILVIWHFPSLTGPPDDLYQRFKKLPYKNKILITGNEFKENEDFIYKLNIYGESYHHGKHLHYKSNFSKKKYYDDIPFVDIINKCK